MQVPLQRRAVDSKGLLLSAQSNPPPSSLYIFMTHRFHYLHDKACISNASDGNAYNDSEREYYNQRATVEVWLPSKLNSLSKHVPSLKYLDLDDNFRLLQNRKDVGQPRREVRSPPCLKYHL